MITLDSKTSSYRLYKVEDKTLPSNTFIFCSSPSREILYNPHIAGKKLQEKTEELSKIFIEIATEKALKGERIVDLTEVVLLAGGLYYNLARGFRAVHDNILQQCFLGIKRQRVENTEGQFIAVSTYENFEALPKNAVVIIGDTIATGATLVRAIGEIERAAEEKEAKIKKLVICSLACATAGARKLKKLEEKMRLLNPSLQLYLIAAEQLFHLMPNGTDMRFLCEDSIMPEETKEYTISKYGEVLGKEMKCAVFDWGTRCKNPRRHYEEFLEFANSVINKLDKKGKTEIERMINEVEEELAKLNQIIGNERGKD
jgi:uracil phosphoribosyltransferase